MTNGIELGCLYFSAACSHVVRQLKPRPGPCIGGLKLKQVAWPPLAPPAGLENDQYVRQIDGYLPTAEVAFIDEIFKVRAGLVLPGAVHLRQLALAGCAYTDCACCPCNGSCCFRLPTHPLALPSPPPPQANSAILNALLTLLNERLFDNGSERITVPLTCLVRAGGACWLVTVFRRGVLEEAARLLSSANKLRMHACTRYICHRQTVGVHSETPHGLTLCCSTRPRPALVSLLQVGASNELPESEELDALYDRFLIRRNVAQVRGGGAAEVAGAQDGWCG